MTDPQPERQRLLTRLGGLATHLVRAVVFAVRKYARDRGPQLSAAVAYRVLFSLVPLLTLLVSILGLLMKDEQRRSEVIQYIFDNVPLADDAQLDIERYLKEIPSPASAAGLVSILVLLWAASGMMGALRVGVTTAIDGRSNRPYLRSKLLDLGLVLGVGLLVLASFALSLLSNAVNSMSETLADALGISSPGQAGLLAALIPLVLVAAVCVSAYRWLPTSSAPWRAIGVATLLVVAATQVVSFALGWYLSEIASYNVVYGSLGSIFGFLFAVYIEATVFLIGAEIVHAWPQTVKPGPPSSQPLGDRIRHEIRGQLGLARPADDDR